MRGARLALCALLLACLPAAADLGEIRGGFYAHEGNDSSPAQTAGNNIYLKFFDDRWIGMMFIPYPYAREVSDDVVSKVFTAARRQATSAALLKGKYGLLEEPATIQVERYGYLENRIVFECSALSPCTIRLDNGALDLIKPGVINEHIIRYTHVSAP